MAFWWNAGGLFLVFAWILQRLLPRGWKGTASAVAIAALLSAIPFFGHTPRFWLSGLTPNVSVSFFALLAIAIAQRAGCPAVFRASEWRAAWIFGCVAALVLYPSALGLLSRNFDSYSLGWPWLEWVQSSAMFGAVAVTAGVLVWRGNRFGWVLVACAVLYLLGLQESRNFWDYLLDPLYAAVSLLAALRWAVARLRRG